MFPFRLLLRGSGLSSMVALASIGLMGVLTVTSCTGVIGDEGAAAGAASAPETRMRPRDSGPEQCQAAQAEGDPVQAPQQCSSVPVCEGTACGCSSGEAACGGRCVLLQEDEAHCGTCDNACGNGQTCQGGECVCPADQSLCNGSCRRLASDNDHCGVCNEACGAGQTCSNGACECAAGQSLCGDACVDTATSDAHCGTCGGACGPGQRCSAGACMEVRGEDGCGGAALGASIAQIAVYQSVKITVMDAGASVPPAMRKADVIAGRESVFRIYVDAKQGFAARELSARLTLKTGDRSTQYFTKIAVKKSSEDLDPGTTFQIFVPADALASGSEYSVELVECGTGKGAAAAPRFPATGHASLDVRQTGGIKIKLIPILANGRAPDVSAAALTTYRELVQALFPVDSVQITVGDQLSTAYPIDWPAALDQLRSKRGSDRPAADVYYYGLLRPEDSLAAFCGDSCTTGIGYVATNSTSASLRVALGVGYGDRISAEVMAHELGHTLGRNHAPCVRGGSIAGVDSAYPYANGIIGSTGYDARRKAFLFADRNTDIMGYCNNKWISDYTYKAFSDRVATVNTTARSAFVTAEALQRWRVLLVGQQGPRWGAAITTPSLPEGEPVTARILDAAGTLVEEVEVYRTEISDGGGAMFMVPEPKRRWLSVQVPGSAALPFVP